MKFHYVYILYNKTKNFIYIGFSEDLRKRVASRNDVLPAHGRAGFPRKGRGLLFLPASSPPMEGRSIRRRKNKGENKSTNAYVPLELIHYEAYRNKKDAKRRELYLKSNKGRTTLITMLKEYFSS